MLNRIKKKDVFENHRNFTKTFLKYVKEELNPNKNNLYTDGKKYFKPNGKSYKGYYHQMANGKVMTGKKHTKNSILLSIGNGIKSTTSKVKSSTTKTTSSKTSSSRSSGGSKGGGGGY